MVFKMFSCHEFSLYFDNKIQWSDNASKFGDSYPVQAMIFYMFIMIIPSTVLRSCLLISKKETTARGAVQLHSLGELKQRINQSKVRPDTLISLSPINVTFTLYCSGINELIYTPMSDG